MRKFTALFLLLFGFYQFSQADTGCVRGYFSPTEDIFTTQSGVAMGYPNYINVIRNNSAFPNSCPRYDYYSTEIIYTGSPQLPIRCCIQGNCDISYALVTYNPIACPIDTWVLLLVLGLAIAGYYFIRKRHLSLPVFQNL